MYSKALSTCFLAVPPGITALLAASPQVDARNFFDFNSGSPAPFKCTQFGCLINGGVERWFDAWVFMPVDRRGNLGRNLVIGLEFTDADFRLSRTPGSPKEFGPN
jgi:hypothetical protein